MPGKKADGALVREFVDRTGVRRYWYDESVLQRNFGIWRLRKRYPSRLSDRLALRVLEVPAHVGVQQRELERQETSEHFDEFFGRVWPEQEETSNKDKMRENAITRRKLVLQWTKGIVNASYEAILRLRRRSFLPKAHMIGHDSVFRLRHLLRYLCYPEELECDIELVDWVKLTHDAWRIHKLVCSMDAETRAIFLREEMPIHFLNEQDGQVQTYHEMDNMENHGRHRHCLDGCFDDRLPAVDATLGDCADLLRQEVRDSAEQYRERLQRPWFLEHAENLPDSVKDSAEDSSVEDGTMQSVCDSDRGTDGETRDPFAQFSFSMDPKRWLGLPKVKCTQCQRSAQVFCQRCLCWTTELRPDRRLQLPIQLAVLRHPKLRTSSATGLAACVLSENAKHFCFPDLDNPVGSKSDNEDWFNPEDTMVLSIADDARYWDQVPTEELAQIRRVVVLESTWRTWKQLAAHPRVKQLRHVRIRRHETLFWKHQEFGAECLSTIEAVYWCMREYAERVHSDNERDRTSLDDLLLCFAKQHANVVANTLACNKRPPKGWTGGGVLPPPS
ncbi:MAG: hypothetical protein MHM6MM_007357 [Cercozoa sp. M6MM]